MDRIAQGDNKELQSRWSQHEMEKAFNHMPLADPERGMFGATPVETVHAYRKGIIEMVTFLVLEMFPQAGKPCLTILH